MRKVPLKSCYIDETTQPPYRKPSKKLTYLFTATNALEPSGLITHTQIDHYAVGKNSRYVSSFYFCFLCPSHIFCTNFCTFVYFLVLQLIFVHNRVSIVYYSNRSNNSWQLKKIMLEEVKSVEKLSELWNCKTLCFKSFDIPNCLFN